MKFYYSYLGPEILRGFDAYKYSSKDTSPLSNYVMHPFWNQVFCNLTISAPVYHLECCRLSNCVQCGWPQIC